MAVCRNVCLTTSLGSSPAAETTLRKGFSMAIVWPVMRDPATPPQRRDDMAKACAPYMHARLAAVDPETGKAVDQPQVNIMVAARQVALLLQKAHKRIEQVETVSSSTSIGE